MSISAYPQRPGNKSPLLAVLILGIAAMADSPALVAADADAAPAAADNQDIRIVPQIMAGTAGFEPGVAVEWRSALLGDWVLRPEVFLSENVRVGAGLSALYDFSPALALPKNQAFELGPRLVFHNADHTGWEGDALATYTYSLDDQPKAFRQSVGLLGTLGLCDHRDNGDNRIQIGASLGAFYSFRF